MIGSVIGPSYVGSPSVLNRMRAVYEKRAAKEHRLPYQVVSCY